MPIYRADDLRDNPPTKEPSLIGDGLLPHTGMMMLIGQTEAGKSILAFDMAFSLALKEPLFGAYYKRHGEENVPYFPVRKPCKVLYLDSELGPSGCHQRLLNFYAQRSPDTNLDDYLHIVSGDYKPLLIHETRTDNGVAYNNLKDLIKDISPAVVIIDHLGDYHLMDEDSNLMRIILKGLRQLQYEHKFAVIILHHESDKQIFTIKGELIEKSGTGRQRGHSSIAQSMDTILAIRRESKQSSQTMLKIDWLKVRHGKKPKTGWIFADMARMKVQWFGPAHKSLPADRRAFLVKYKEENKIEDIDE